MAPRPSRWTHRRLRRQVSAFVDGELDLATAAAVERHVRLCWGCSSAVEQLRLIKASLRHISRKQPDALGAARLRRWGDGVAVQVPLTVPAPTAVSTVVNTDHGGY